MNPIKVMVNGSRGRMGRAIAESAENTDVHISAQIDLALFGHPNVPGSYRKIAFLVYNHKPMDNANQEDEPRSLPQAW